MRRKYKEIKFSDLSGVNNKFYYDQENPSNFVKSDHIQVDKNTNRIRLADDFSSQVLSDPVNFEIERRLIANFANTNLRKNYNFVAGQKDGETTRVYRRDDFGAYTLKFTFPAGYINPRYVLSFRNKLIVFTYNSGEKISYSINSTDTTPTFTHADWAYDKIRCHVVGSDGYLYVADYTGSVIRTIDGVSWELYYDGNTLEEQISSIEELDGYIYAIVSTQGFVESNFCRITGDELQYLKKFNNDYNETTIKKFGERIIISDISDQVIEIHEFDKGDFNFITSVDYHNYTRVLLLYANKDNLYFSASVEAGLTQHNRYLFLMNKNNGIQYIKDFGAYKSVEQAIGFNGRELFQVNTFDEDTPPDGFYKIYVYDNGNTPNKTAVSGTIELPAIVKKQVPGYLIARHKEMGDNATLTIKVKKNHEATFAATVLTDNVNDSVEKIVDLKSIGEIISLQFEITLADTTPVNGIEDLELIYLYLPVGLENST